MTEPSGYEYRDDSIVARISVDVPASTLTDLDQVRERASALRTELEAIARAQGDWLGSLQQIPQITEQANQAYRNMITQLERISYIQQETGGSQANVGMSGGPIGGQAGQPYSTAAPAGYMDPFMGMPGTGMGMGMQGAQSYMQSMMMNDPRMYANMAAQRGFPINPTQLGLVGGAVAAQQGAAPHTGGGMGQGAPTPGSMSPQPTSGSRDSSAQPDPSQSGAPDTSEKQRDPATPHPDTPAWQKTLSSIAGTAGAVINETKGGMGRGGGLIGGAAGALGAIGRIGGNSGGGGGGDDGDDGSGGGGGGGGGGLGGFGRIAAGAGLAGVGLGLGVKGLGKIQDAGEQIQQYRNLGAESGGGAVEGAGFEMQARMMSMNPFITLDQSRSIMQSALKNGYTGKEFDTVTAFMADNLKEMNMSSTESMQLFQSVVEKGKGSVDDLAKTMDNLKSFTGLSGNKMGQTQRNQQFEGLTSLAADAGMSGSAGTSMATSINEAFGDSQVLKNFGDVAQGGLENPLFLTTMAQVNGLRVQDPSEVLDALSEEGIDPGTAFQKTMKRFADMAVSNSGGKLRNAASAFKRLLSQAGVNITMAQAKELLPKVLGGNPFTKDVDAKQALADAGQGRTIGDQIGNMLGPVAAPFHAAWGVVEAALAPITPLTTEGANAEFSAAGNDFGDFGKQIGEWMTSPEEIAGNARAKTDSRSATATAAPQMIDRGGHVTEGRVTGDVTITVNRDGSVSAPPSVQISGSQKGVYAGYSSSTINNPAPGDPAFQHAMPPFGGG